MGFEKVINVELFEQLKIFDTKKFLKKLTDLNGEGQFLLEVLYGHANPVDKSAPKDAHIDSRANYMLINSIEEEKFRKGMVHFETGTMKYSGNNDYFENMVLVTEDEIETGQTTSIPRITLKMRLIIPQDSNRLICRRYDRQRYIWNMGWERTPKFHSLLPTSEFIKNEYLSNIEETFNSNPVK